MTAAFFTSRALPAPPRLLALLCAALTALGECGAQQFKEFTPGVAYANHTTTATEPPKQLWSIHLVRVDRARRELEMESAHAKNAALGMATLSDQIKAVKREWGVPVAGVNGDFYERGSSYAGDPRGLQILHGELISAPTTGASFWVDDAGNPHTAKVESQFAVTWPDGTSSEMGLNEDYGTNIVVLHTPAIGAATKTRAGTTELILERTGEGPWLPLKVGENFSARVREVRETGATPFAPDTMVLALNPDFARTLPKVEAGAVLKISTATTPDVRGARTSISGGPVLVHEGQKQDLKNTPKATGPMAEYSYRSMFQRHPRSAVGWNDRSLFLIEVDGRQPGLSMGMKLEEVADYMIQLGCTEVMNLDGGGSATMWVNGRVVNSTSESDNGERPIANSLLVVRKSSSPGAGAQNARQAP